jgi:hypothetical protein
MIRAIPKKVLIHSIEVIDQVTKTTHNLSRVLVQCNRGLTYSIAGEEMKSSSILFIDLKNSVYSDLSVIKNGNVVVFNGDRYNIKNIVYGTGFKEHHLEVTIV